MGGHEIPLRTYFISRQKTKLEHGCCSKREDRATKMKDMAIIFIILFVIKSVRCICESAKHDIVTVVTAKTIYKNNKR